VGQRFASGLSADEALKILTSAQARTRLGGVIGQDAQVIPMSDQGDIYRLVSSRGDLIVRFPGDEARLSVLAKEERVQAGLRERVSLLIPDTQVVDDLDGIPAFAIHHTIPGTPLDTDCYEGLSPAGRDRLVGDLARFFRETHSVPLEVACGWLGIPFDGERTAANLATAQRNHEWFGPDAVAEMRPQLDPLLDDDGARVFEDTVRLFHARQVSPEEMVFCHGDIHGYNVAMGEDELGARIVGVFDLGCTGILDIHEDFFRLSLVSEDLVERVMAAYQALPGQRRTLDRDRIALFYRAFLFHLMVGKAGESLAHLKRLLQKHLVYYEDR
jgi:aminoglycoside phosphotransferase